MTKYYALVGAVAHWERMIAWVKTQDSRYHVNIDIMHSALRTNWDDNRCDTLCSNYYEGGDCDDCPMSPRCDNDQSLWMQFSSDLTWRDWLKTANKMLKKLIRMRDKEDTKIYGGI